MIKELVRKIIKGERISLAKAISLVENCSAESILLSEQIAPYLGRAHRLGITGPPGVGKSTLTNELAALMSRKKYPVGIVAVDPSSVFTGGAILGDRIRMQKIGLDEGVFIRSMATRGCLGGLAEATTAAADILDAAGKKYIIIETVGVGQSEIEIFKAVDNTIVVLSPESGDAIQTMKSGLMEIADIIVVNKADRPQADILVNTIKTTAEFSSKSKNIPIFKTVATQGAGVEELFNHLENYFNSDDQARVFSEKRKYFFQERIKSLVLKKIGNDLWSNPEIQKLLESTTGKIQDGKNMGTKLVARIISLFKEKK